MAEYIATFHYQAFRDIFTDRMQGTRVVFSFDGKPGDTIREAFRWFQNKQQTEPKFFNRLLAAKVDTFHIREIDKNGVIPHAQGIMVAEWVRKTDPLPEGFVIG